MSDTGRGTPRLALVIAGGPTPTGPLELPRPDLVIAADSGLHLALQLGLPVDVLVGDLDSVDPALTPRAARVDRHPVAKDATDLELALDEAVRHGPERILVVASAGGRLDHALAGLLLLANPAYAAIRIDAVVDGTRVHVLHGPRELVTEPGELVTLVAVGGPARLRRTTGLRWPLQDDELRPGSSRGVSNVATADRVVIEVVSGTLIVVRPGAGTR